VGSDRATSHFPLPTTHVIAGFAGDHSAASEIDSDSEGCTIKVSTKT